MLRRIRFLPPAACALAVLSLLWAGRALAASGVHEARHEPATTSSRKVDPYARQIARQGKIVIISRHLVDEVRKDNQIVLGKVAIRTRIGRDGELAGYELVEVDKGSIPEDIGFRIRDQIVAINGIPAKDFEANQKHLQSAGRFDVRILRKGKMKRIVVEVREAIR